MKNHLSMSNNGNLKPTGEWRRKFDLQAWGAECRAVEKEIKES